MEEYFCNDMLLLVSDAYSKVSDHAILARFPFLVLNNMLLFFLILNTYILYLL